jgi:uncharacterized protein (DUF433 family)
MTSEMDMKKHPRITMIPGLCGGRPTIRGMRIRVVDILGYLAAGDTTETLLDGFPDLEPEDIAAALAFAQDVVNTTEDPQLQAAE